MGGVHGIGLQNVTLQIDGTLEFSDDQKEWPRRADNSVLECIYLEQLDQVTITSSNPDKGELSRCVGRKTWS